MSMNWNESSKKFKAYSQLAGIRLDYLSSAYISTLFWFRKPSINMIQNTLCELKKN